MVKSGGSKFDARSSGFGHDLEHPLVAAMIHHLASGHDKNFLVAYSATLTTPLRLPLMRRDYPFPTTPLLRRDYSFVWLPILRHDHSLADPLFCHTIYIAITDDTCHYLYRVHVLFQ